ncbi:MAG: 3-hydroxybutyryl-CoA dehydrogenase [Acidiferrobacteraceae bacterium]|nr:3-hydroxybutyryl-CoA dehydrogenase [Acidiferrobacteraceae bacterium]
MKRINTFGIIGAGVIGAGWTVRALARGLDVLVWDPNPISLKQLRSTVDQVWPTMMRIGLAPDASTARLSIADSVETIAERADFIQESAPERLELKKDLHHRIDLVARHDVIIASSTSGLLPSELQSSCRNPERVVVGHPFNPVYILPLVEVVGGSATSESNVTKAIGFYKSIGMHPLLVRKEVPGFLSDRLQEALWREALHLVSEGVATPEELDIAISYGPGLRWALWGTCMIFHLAGGPGGMRHMLEHFNPELFPWSRIPPPSITKELVDEMHAGCEEQMDSRSIQDIEKIRDDALVDILKVLHENGVGAGKYFRGV